MASERIPVSERMQNKILKDKFPGSQGKSEAMFLVYFPAEMKYSLVEGKNITSPDYPVVGDLATIRDSKGDTFKGKVTCIGGREKCLEKQALLEKILSGKLDDEDNANDSVEESERIKKSFKRVRTTLKATDGKRKRTQLASSDEEDESDVETTPRKEISMELTKEAKRVSNLLKMSAAGHEQQSLPNVMVEGSVTTSALKQITDRLDDIKELLQYLVNEKKKQGDSQLLATVSTPPMKKPKVLSCSSPVDVSSHASLSRASASPCSSATVSAEEMDGENQDEFIIGGINLLRDVNARFKKPNLYATSLMSHLFTDEEMREGSVEPNELCKKSALDQNKINLIKKCIVIKYGEKALEKRGWHDIRLSLNQKCLDKMKAWKRKNNTNSSKDARVTTIAVSVEEKPKDK